MSSAAHCPSCGTPLGGLVYNGERHWSRRCGHTINPSDLGGGR